MDRAGRFDADGPAAGRYVPPFVTAAWALTEARPVSEPVTTEFGLHVLLRVEHLPPEPAQESVVRRVVRWDLVNGARSQSLQELLVHVRARHRWHLSLETTHRLLGVAEAP
jgi:parvulin-like peptidyl-prolyl isomerase